jgi:hypothetical protein
MNNNPLVIISILSIQKIWHGKIGRNFNQKRKIYCRFYPSCSNYAIMALEKYGFFIGWIKTIDRVHRCNPFNTDSCVDFP